MNKGKVAIVVFKITEKIEFIFGWILSIFVLMLSFFCILYKIFSIYLIIFDLTVLGVGIILIIKANKRKRFRKLFVEYVGILSLEPVGSIKRIAVKKGVSVSECKKDVQEMIDRRFFTKAYFNEEEDRIILPMCSANVKEKIRLGEKKSYKSCICPMCTGASLMIEKKDTICDFCGYTIKAY